MLMYDSFWIMFFFWGGGAVRGLAMKDTSLMKTGKKEGKVALDPCEPEALYQPRTEGTHKVSGDFLRLQS